MDHAVSMDLQKIGKSAINEGTGTINLTCQHMFDYMCWGNLGTLEWLVNKKGGNHDQSEW